MKLKFNKTKKHWRINKNIYLVSDDKKFQKNKFLKSYGDFCISIKDELVNNKSVDFGKMVSEYLCSDNRKLFWVYINERCIGHIGFTFLFDENGEISSVVFDNVIMNYKEVNFSIKNLALIFEKLIYERLLDEIPTINNVFFDVYESDTWWKYSLMNELGFKLLHNGDDIAKHHNKKDNDSFRRHILNDGNLNDMKESANINDFEKLNVFYLTSLKENPLKALYNQNIFNENLVLKTNKKTVVDDYFDYDTNLFNLDLLLQNNLNPYIFDNYKHFKKYLKKEIINQIDSIPLALVQKYKVEEIDLNNPLNAETEQYYRQEIYEIIKNYLKVKYIKQTTGHEIDFSANNKRVWLRINYSAIFKCPSPSKDRIDCSINFNALKADAFEKNIKCYVVKNTKPQLQKHIPYQKIELIYVFENTDEDNINLTKTINGKVIKWEIVAIMTETELSGQKLRESLSQCIGIRPEQIYVDGKVPYHYVSSNNKNVTKHQWKVYQKRFISKSIKDINKNTKKCPLIESDTISNLLLMASNKYQNISNIKIWNYQSFLNNNLELNAINNIERYSGFNKNSRTSDIPERINKVEVKDNKKILRNQLKDIQWYYQFLSSNIVDKSLENPEVNDIYKISDEHINTRKNSQSKYKLCDNRFNFVYNTDNTYITEKLMYANRDTNVINYSDNRDLLIRMNQFARTVYRKQYTNEKLNIKEGKKSRRFNAAQFGTFWTAVVFFVLAFKDAFVGWMINDGDTSGFRGIGISGWILFGISLVLMIVFIIIKVMRTSDWTAIKRIECHWKWWYKFVSRKKVFNADKYTLVVDNVDETGESLGQFLDLFNESKIYKKFPFRTIFIFNNTKDYSKLKTEIDSRLKMMETYGKSISYGHHLVDDEDDYNVLIKKFRQTIYFENYKDKNGDLPWFMPFVSKRDVYISTFMNDKDEGYEDPINMKGNKPWREFEQSLKFFILKIKFNTFEFEEFVQVVNKQLEEKYDQVNKYYELLKKREGEFANVENTETEIVNYNYYFLCKITWLTILNWIYDNEFVESRIKTAIQLYEKLNLRYKRQNKLLENPMSSAGVSRDIDNLVLYDPKKRPIRTNLEKRIPKDLSIGDNGMVVKLNFGNQYDDNDGEMLFQYPIAESKMQEQEEAKKES